MKTYTLDELGNPKINLKEVNCNFKTKINMNNFESAYIPAEKLIKKCSVCGKEREIKVIIGKSFNSPKTEDEATDIITNGIFHNTFVILCEGCVVISKI